LLLEGRDLLGGKLVAYLGGVRETRAVRQWAEGARVIQDKADKQRLRLAYQVAVLVGERDSAGVVQAWFQGLNPELHADGAEYPSQRPGVVPATWLEAREASAATLSGVYCAVADKESLPTLRAMFLPGALKYGLADLGAGEEPPQWAARLRPPPVTSR